MTMFENAFTSYLVENGWIEVRPMNYRQNGSDVEIFFDTSSQIEVYKGKKNVGNFYLQTLDDLMKVLKDFG